MINGGLRWVLMSQWTIIRYGQLRIPIRAVVQIHGVVKNVMAGITKVRMVLMLLARTSLVSLVYWAQKTHWVG